MRFPMITAPSIRIGQHLVRRIGYEQIRPGDLVCTYEALTTRPDLLAIRTLQKYATFSHRPELNKMFHFEVIVDKHPRLGAFRIAHADGSTQKVGMQNDNFKDHHPGQAFLIFRAKDEAIRKEIVAIATKTAEPGNGHTCRILKLDSWFHRLGNIFRFFKFENLWHKASHRTLKNVAQMTAEYEATGRFYTPEGTGARAMSCVEYVANVVNVATARALKPAPLAASQSERTESVFNQFKEINSSPAARGFPLKYSNGDATPASLVDFLLKNPSQFKTVGYLGAISEQIDGPILDIQGDPIPFSLERLSRVIRSEDPQEMQPNPMYAAKVMKALGMLSDSWQLYPKAAKDPAKIQTLFAALNAHMYKQPLSALAKSLSKMKMDVAACQRLAEQLRLITIESGLDEKGAPFGGVSPKIGSLSFEDWKLILSLEKEFLKSAPMERTEKTLKMSLNVLATQRVASEKIQAVAQRAFGIGRYLWSSVVLAPISLGFTLVGNVCNRIAAARQRAIDTQRYELLSVHERVRKNGRITLQTNVAAGNRPWIQYSVDGGKTWDQEPFMARASAWDAHLHIPDGSDIQYKLFIGPEDVNDVDPVGKAAAWQQTESPEGVFVPHHKMGKSPENSFMAIDACPHPVWNGEMNFPQRSPDVFVYQARCNQIAPLNDWPPTVQEYEDNFAKLEAQLEPLITVDQVHEDPIVNQLQIFVEKKLGMKILPEQIQFMNGGLGKGLSGDKIYRVVDALQNPILIVKVFMKSRSKFSREFYTLMNHEGLNLKHLNLPTVLGIGASRAQDSPIYFLATNFIPGISIYELFTQLMSNKVGSRERSDLLKKLLHVYAKFGQGLAELHRSAKTHPQSMHPAFIDLLRVFSKNAFKKFKDHLEPSFVAKLEAFFEERFAVQRQKQFALGYIHGDINPGNLLINFATDQLSCVDWPDGSLSVGQNGVATGIPFYDLIQIRNELIMRKSQGLTDEEIDQILQVFMHHYTANGGTTESPQTMEFFSAVDLIGSIKWFIDKKDRFVPGQLAIAEGVYKQKLHQLGTLIGAIY